MSFDLLLRDFPSFATAPNSIHKVRELILKLALLGKLKTQDSTDEPASKQLERIAKDLGKSAAIQEHTKDSSSLHNLPERWVPAKLGELVGPSTERVEPSRAKELPYIGLEHIEKSTGRLLTRGSSTQVKSTKSRFYAGDLLYGRLRPYLNKVLVAEFDGICSTDILVFSKNRNLSNRYLAMLFLSHDFVNYASQNVTGINHPRVSFKTLSRFPLFLPPFAEQLRIVDKLDKLMALCDELEAMQQAEKSGCIRLSTALLTALQNATNAADLTRFWSLVSQHFDSLFDCQENINALRKAVLQLAIRGKLVSHYSTEDTKSELSYRLPEQPIKQFTLEVPQHSPADLLTSSDFPAGWILARIGDIALFVGSGITPRGGKSNYFSTGIPFIRSQNVLVNKLKLDDVSYITKEQHEIMSRTKVHPGDVLLNITGASIGRSSPVPENFSEANVNQHVCIIRPSSIISHRFLAFYLNSSFGQAQIFAIQSGATREGLNYNQVRSLIVPIPPLVEQKSIVSKLDNFMTLCDQLETKIEEGRKISELFSESVVKASLAEP
jgi:type I restriction enzyme S subunit